MHTQSIEENTAYVIGVDVGTGSARAGIFDTRGHLVASDKAPIAMFRQGAERVEQSSEDIWQAVVTAIQGAMSNARVTADVITGLGFDATCSLVVIGPRGQPLPVGDEQHPERNIIVWMDHRANEQATRINQHRHPVLDYVGGRISPEMETPKLLWLKENRPTTYQDAWQFLDLTDYLTWRATGSLARSVCTVTCKWTYLAHENRWDPDYFRAIGLEDLADADFARIGTEMVEPGSALGQGLTKISAEQLGLLPGTPVAAGLIDAHAGGIGSIGAGPDNPPEHNLAYVFGTSSCTMTSTTEPVLVPGVWGPYYSAMVPGYWLNEGGQSAAGAAIEQLLRLHPYSAVAQSLAEQQNQSLPEWLADQAIHNALSVSDAVHCAKGLHVVPEFLGNRAPFADPHCRAVIAGLGMVNELDSLIALYVAGLCGIGYGLRQILEAQEAAGAPVKRLVISGGAGRHRLIRQLLADTTGYAVVAPTSDEPVLLGSAILATVASSHHESIQVAMAEMTSINASYQPCEGELKRLHHNRFQTFAQLQRTARESTVF